MKSLVLAIGLLAGVVIVAQPVLKQYIDSVKICKSSEQKEEQDKQNPDQEEVSAFEAVTPTVQVLVTIADYFIVSDAMNEESSDKFEFTTFTDKVFQKLSRILFNFIIAPNAP